ncbi:MAG: LytTR family transcriptional regulator DNA-binding domain-containing protein [Crocinitomicaceae bacterium]|nr:LytTR family transcriptional regulator DNA-binding domain-containing protein [Crocinitomicaceae bacterium]
MIQSIVYKGDGGSLKGGIGSLLDEKFPSISIMGVVNDLSEGLFKLVGSEIDIFFFEVGPTDVIDPKILDRINNSGTEIVLICSKNLLPIEIFNHDIFFYLEKPLYEEKIRQLVGKFESKKQDSKMFMESDRISIPVKDGWEIIRVEDIVYCQADSNYTDLHLVDGKKRKVSKPLKMYAECLYSKSFVRIHQSYLVNSRYMKKLSKDKSPSLFLSTGISIPVSRSGKKELLKLFL